MYIKELLVVTVSDINIIFKNIFFERNINTLFWVTWTTVCKIHTGDDVVANYVGLMSV